jgi:hypothetical protein
MPIIRVPKKGGPIGCLAANVEIFVVVGIVMLATSKGNWQIILFALALILITVLAFIRSVRSG